MNWHVHRLREELHKEIGRAIANRMSDPRIPPVVTVTEVRLATDCRNATIFVSIFGDDNVEKGAISPCSTKPRRFSSMLYPKTSW